MPRLQPFYENVQSHYDLSDDFFGLFLDPTRTYSCAYFERDDMTLEEAQRAKIELSLGKCDLRPGMTLLDIGCGWGTMMFRAAEEYDVHVIGLTLSRNQYEHVNERISTTRLPRTVEVRLEGWEDFEGRVDRIVSVGAFEHFRRERYGAFFEKCAGMLPSDGRMMLHTIVGYGQELREMGLPITRELIAFHRFLVKEIFPGGQIPLVGWVTDPAEAAGFRVERVQPLQSHYARTLDCWAAALSANHEKAVEIASEEIYERYVKYLSGCAERFREGYINVMQFTLVK